MTRAERAKEAAALRAQGLNGLQIAERMGVSKTYAYDLLNDPDGSKVRERKDSYRGECEDCGALTDGSNGRTRAPSLCNACRRVRQTAAFREHVIAELRRWDELYGRLPAACDWNVASMMNRNRRYDDGEPVGRFSDERIVEMKRRHRDQGPWPSTAGVVNAFGSWNDAIRAAGFEAIPVSSGRRRVAA